MRNNTSNKKAQKNNNKFPEHGKKERGKTKNKTNEEVICYRQGRASVCLIVCVDGPYISLILYLVELKLVLIEVQIVITTCQGVTFITSILELHV